MFLFFLICKLVFLTSMQLVTASIWAMIHIIHRLRPGKPLGKFDPSHSEGLVCVHPTSEPWLRYSTDDDWWDDVDQTSLNGFKKVLKSRRKAEMGFFMDWSSAESLWSHLLLNWCDHWPVATPGKLPCKLGAVTYLQFYIRVYFRYTGCFVSVRDIVVLSIN